MNKRIKKKVRRRRGRGRMLAISDISIYENVGFTPYTYENGHSPHGYETITDSPFIARLQSAMHMIEGE